MDSPASSKHVFVIGGANGIGRAIVQALAAAGYQITFTFHGTDDAAKSLLAECQKSNDAATIQRHKIDLRNKDEVDQLAQLLADAENLYGLVYNAGNSYDNLAALVDQDRAESLFQLNFWAMTRLCAAASRPMMRAKTGRIIGMGSVTSRHGVQGNSIYAASKGAMLSYIRTLSVELARKGVTANYISPGFVDTKLMAGYGDHRDKIEKQIPLRRFAQPQEIGELARFLLSPSAGYITGSVIPIDGGLDAALAVQR